MVYFLFSRTPLCWEVHPLRVPWALLCFVRTGLGVIMRAPTGGNRAGSRCGAGDEFRLSPEPPLPPWGFV